jgi:putative hydrolase of the HAD superfamily
MNQSSIRAVIFDMGGTLEDVRYDNDLRLKATRELQDLLASEGLDPGLALEDLYALIDSNMKKYKEQQVATEREVSPEELWTAHIFSSDHLPRQRVSVIADELSFFYENHFYARRLRDEVPSVLASLSARGYRLGVISNSIGRQTMPRNLAAYGIDRYFHPVVSSACVGWRKPNVRIFRAATDALGLGPSACAYVGDTISRDVIGARRAGFGLAIQIKSFLTDKSDQENDIEPPDAVVENLTQVIELVDGRE